MTCKYLVANFLILFTLAGESIFSQDLSYYLPQSVTYNALILKPEDVTGFKVGQFLMSHDNIFYYFQQLAISSPRVKYEVYGKTHENRPLTLAIFSSEANIKRIEEIRLQHLQLSDPYNSSKLNTDDLPVVVWLNHSVHGNEPSGANSALLTAYYLAAATGKEIDDLLDKTIILIDPAANPDGIQRFSTWANGHKSYMTNPDPASTEHNESWPGSRFNHYGFDLNRDWLTLVQPESEFRIKKYLEWRPNVLIDLHEMGTNSTYHFSPGDPSRVSPLISSANQLLAQKLADNHAKAFDKAGSFYFSGERFDDYFDGKGATYPDINGSVSSLFEQSSSRGFVQESENGLLSFPFGIRNQLIGSLSTINTAFTFKNEFLEYQRNYFISAIDESKKDKQKAYIFGADYDPNTTFAFAKLLNAQGIKTYRLKKDISVGETSFKASLAYVVPLDQQQYRLMKSIFGLHLQSKDSTFYDISAWNLPQAYNLPYASINSYTDIIGDSYSPSQSPLGKIIGNGTAYAYIFKWLDQMAPRALSRLLQENIIVKVATKSFETMDGLKFERGSVLIPLGTINTDTSKIETIITEINKADGIDIYCLSSGDNKATDLGSPYFSVIEKPRIAVLTEGGVDGIRSGEIWHLLDTRYKIPFTLLPSKALKQLNLNKYSVIVFPNGNYQDLDEKVVGKLQDWLAAGNTLIAFENAASWLNKNKLIQVELEKEENKAVGYSYENAILYNASREVPGTAFETVLDLTHPINFGYKTEKLPVLKDNNIIQLKAESISANYPARYGKAPLIDGYAPPRFVEALSGTPALGIFGAKSGRIIVFYNNSNFRGYWLGTNRQFINSLFLSNKFQLPKEITNN